MKTIVIGDIHGCFSEMLALLAKVGHNPDEDRVLLTGDLTDRGPDVLGVIDYAIVHKFESVMGNHDHKWVRYHKHQLKRAEDPTYKNPMFRHHRQAFYETMESRHHAYLAQLKPYIQMAPDWIVVHAGLFPHIPVEDHDSKLWYIRWLHEETNAFVPLSGSMGRPPNAVFWTNRWRGPGSVIYGHTSTDGVKIENGTYGIDTACCYGGELTAAIFDDPITSESEPRFESVKATNVYAIRMGDE